MEFKALIEFNKYTLALSAASFAYALEKFVPMPTNGGRLPLLIVLGIFFVCALLGVIIFAAATSALHPSKAAKQASIARIIAPLGIAHTVLLVAGLLILGWMLYGRVMAAPEASKQTTCCAVACPK